jgi:TolA-binding protein
MSVAELHPEDLIDKELLGELTADERARLEAHLAQCASCRFERASREDFRLDFEDEARRVLPEEPAALGPRVAAPRRGAARRLRVAALLAAAVVVVSAVAAAVSVVRSGSRATGAYDGTTVNRPAEPVAPVTSPRVASPMAGTAVTIAPAASAEPAPDVTPSAAVLPPAPAPEDDAATVFSRGSDALRRGDYAAARAEFRGLQARHPGTLQARASYAILGRLSLDQGDYAGALRSFDAYLAAGGGPLVEEAMVGRGRALEGLGRSSDEASAWAALLSAFPASSHAPYARARLQALGER